jgi:hypothetical protein
MSRNPGGRPEVGPKIELRLPEETLARVNAAAGPQKGARAQWLRDAVHQAMPYACLTQYGRHAMAAALADIDGLADFRDEARDVEVPAEERVIAGVKYDETLHEMRVLLGKMREVLPVQEARDAYVAASAADPDVAKEETVKAWARTTAADQLYAILDAVGQLLPVNGPGVRDRASLDDPLMDLDA